MDLRKNSFKKIKKNVYNSDKNKTTFLNKLKQDKEENNTKPHFFDKISYISLKNNNILISILISILFISIMIFAGYALFNYVTKSSYFNITEIKIIGNNYLTEEEVIDITGLKTDTNILNYRINTIENNLLKCDWIQKVKIRRSLPSTYEIEIQERKPIFLVINKNELYYLDSKGQYIAKVENGRFISLPVLYINNATANEINLLPEFINDLEISKFPYALKDISWVNINELYGFELFIEENNLILQIDFKNFGENIKNLVKVLEDLKKRNEIKKVRKIRAAFNKVMIIKD